MSSGACGAHTNCFLHGIAQQNKVEPPELFPPSPHAISLRIVGKHYLDQ